VDVGAVRRADHRLEAIATPLAVVAILVAVPASFLGSHRLSLAVFLEGRGGGDGRAGAGIRGGPTEPGLTVR
jgi:hypothetical protein